ncbi:MAG: DNA polymerase I [Nitrospirae bacterium]|nr:MAG: DNA polymerase I [Nitrospirota bacterium]
MIITLKQKGIDLRGISFDTMIAAHLLNPNRSDNSLESIVVEYLGVMKNSMKDIKGDEDIEDVALHACEDVASVFKLKEILSDLLVEEELEELFNSIEMPLISVLAQMELWGIRVIKPMLKEISKELSDELKEVEKGIFSLAKCSFNINSPKQLQEVLFKKIGLKPIKKTKTGYSTSTEVLQQLSLEHPLPAEILRYRTLSKLKNTYVDTLPNFIDPKTGRIHPTFNQCATATGRLSMSEPNLQNIPVRGEWAFKIRRAFVPEDGCLFISSDYSQIELRILAHMSRDESLIDAFRAGVDIHRKTASDLFGIAPENITEEMRRKAKTVNFGIIYGMSPHGLSQQLNISHKEAKEYIDRFLSTREGVRYYIESIKREASEKGYVKTLFGRRRPIPEINHPNANIRQQGERLAINTPIQGSAADIIKKAMLNIADRIRREGMESRMLLQVHDELLLEVPHKEVDIAKSMLKEEMEGAVQLLVPLKVDISVGKNWAETHK